MTTTTTHTISDRELATVLAALRNWQLDGLNEDMADQYRDHFEDAAMLTDDEIDALCERLNVREAVEDDDEELMPEGDVICPRCGCDTWIAEYDSACIQNVDKLTMQPDGTLMPSYSQACEVIQEGPTEAYRCSDCEYRITKGIAE